MKRPTWVTVIGVLTILFGVSGIFVGGQKMLMPTMLEMQKNMIAEFSKFEAEKDDGNDAVNAPDTGQSPSQSAGANQAIFKMFEEINEQIRIPEWYKNQAISIGAISMAISAFYLLSGIFLLIMKPFAVRSFYFAAGLSILWSAFQVALFAQAGEGMLLMLIPHLIAGILIDAVLVTVVILNAKNFPAATEPADG